MGASEDVTKFVSPTTDSLLGVWAKFMRQGSVGNGYPKRAAGLSTGGINCWDDVEGEWESELASAVNAVMGDLQGRHYCAISNVYCAKVWSYRGQDLDVFPAAISEFERKAKSAGLL